VIVKLSLGEIEQARLVLRGGSIIDWRRLDVASMDECNAILCANGSTLKMLSGLLFILTLLFGL
jgi:hypothetical protein